VVLRYVFILASLLVYFVVLTDVLPTGRIAAGVERFTLSIFFYERFIIPIKSIVRIYTYVVNYCLLANITPATTWRFYSVVFGKLDRNFIRKN
jgi:hypothetical protein